MRFAAVFAIEKGCWGSAGAVNLGVRLAAFFALKNGGWGMAGAAGVFGAVDCRVRRFFARPAKGENSRIFSARRPPAGGEGLSRGRKSFLRAPEQFWWSSRSGRLCSVVRSIRGGLFRIRLHSQILRLRSQILRHCQPAMFVRPGPSISVHQLANFASSLLVEMASAKIAAIAKSKNFFSWCFVGRFVGCFVRCFVGSERKILVKKREAAVQKQHQKSHHKEAKK